MSQPWERRADETPKAFAAFCVYRDMGPGRSIEKLRENSGKTQGYDRVLYQWSSQYNWGRRVDLYDEHLSEVSVQSVEEGIRQDRIVYRDRVKAEAAAFAEAAVAMRREAMMQDNKAEGSLMLQRASAVWEKARQVEGMALGLVSE